MPFPTSRSASSCPSRPAAAPTRSRGSWVRSSRRSGGSRSSSTTGPGAGNIGTALAPSGPGRYTITLAHQGALTINPHLYGTTGYDTLRDFAAVSRGMETASVLVVHPSVPGKYDAGARATRSPGPGVLTFASTASLQQLLGELFKLTTGTNIVHVPYKGAGPR